MHFETQFVVYVLCALTALDESLQRTVSGVGFEGWIVHYVSVYLCIHAREDTKARK